MKRLIYLLVFLPLFANSQVKISALPEATTIGSTDIFILNQSGATKKIPFSVFSYTSIDAGAQINDSLAILRPLISTEISDSIQAASFGTSISFGTSGQIPYMNGSGNDFLYASNLSWNGINLNVNYGTNNLFIGDNSGESTTGQDNTFVGKSSGFSNLSGNYNTFIGKSSGYSSTTASNNTFLGNTSGYTNTSGSENTFIGTNSGYSNTSGINNVFNGYVSGYSNTIGSNNIFLGKSAGYFNSSGNYNIGIGTTALFANATGNNNTSLGYQSGVSNVSGSNNTFIGHESGFKNTASNNTFIGYRVGYSTTSGSENVFLGNNAGRLNVTGIKNVYLGNYAGYNSTGSSNVFVGYQAGQNETGSNKLYISNNATDTLIYGDFSADSIHLNGNVSVDGNIYADNIAPVSGNFGEITYINSAGSGLSTSTNFTWNDTTLNVKSNTGTNNIFIGYKSNSGLLSSASTNNSFGIESLNSITSGDNNIAFGYRSGFNITNASNNIIIGHTSGYNNNGSDNVFIGYASGFDNTSGTNNVYIGRDAGRNNSTGGFNVFLGYEAGRQETGSNKLYIENSNSTTPLIYGDFANDTVKINGSLEVIGRLKVDGRFIHTPYEAALYLDPDSVITTAATTSWKFLGDGNDKKTTVTDVYGFSYDADTLQFDQNAADPRDSVEFHVFGSMVTAASTVNKNVSYGIFIKSVGESTYTEYRPLTTIARTTTADVYYNGAIVTGYPMYLKDGDKVQIQVKLATSTATVSNKNLRILISEH